MHATSRSHHAASLMLIDVLPLRPKALKALVEPWGSAEMNPELSGMSIEGDEELHDALRVWQAVYRWSLRGNRRDLAEEQGSSKAQAPSGTELWTLGLPRTS